MKTLNDLPDSKDKRALVRVDWNVPIADGKVVDDFRIKESLETIKLLREKGFKITLVSHLEPETASLKPVYECAKQYVPELVWEDDGDLVLLENLRQNPGEKGNDPGFAASLASLADIYVNDAFSVSHRAHASIVSVPKLLPSFAGLRFMKEVENLSRFFRPEHPFLFILGGAKFETKLPLVHKFLNLADEICIYGANAAQAYETDLKDNPKVSFPHGDIKALDADAETIENCKLKIENASLILWNGPLGKYEDGYKEGTKKLAQALADSGKTVVIGGADTLAATRELNIYDKFTFVSSAGGAMLDFLANETLPGIEALG